MEENVIRSSVVKRDASDSRSWLATAPICEPLSQHHIAHCGMMHAVSPMKIVRTYLSGTFFLATVKGAGQVLVDGDWQTISPGLACVQPPFMSNALRCLKKTAWHFCWVRYHERAGVQPVASIQSPSVREFNALAFQAAIQGLHAEASTTASPAFMQQWADLVQQYVLAFVSPFRSDHRLHRVWIAVADRLDRSWTLDDLAKIACMSKEHLRRMSLATLGRSPMQQVTYIRLKHAAELLTHSELKVSAISAIVGYDNAFAFSDMFRRWTGYRPSVYRNFGRPKS